MRKIPSLFALLASLALATASRADTVFSDSTFNPGNYQSSIIRDTSPGHTGSFNTSQTGSNGNPGSFLETTFSYFFVSGSGNQELWIGHLLNGGTYTPSTQGGIANVSFTLDSNFINENVGTALGAGILLRQNNQFYSFQTQTLFPPGTGWHSFSQSATPGNSAALEFNGIGFSGHPDFSSSGAPITFGFYESTGEAVGPSTIISMDAGEDNWSVDIESVPEAGTWAIGILATALLVFQIIRAPTFSRRRS